MNSNSIATPASPPTNVRWMVLAVATLSSVLLYLDRVGAQFIVESIRVEFGATQREMGWYLAAFFWSYALGQVPAGQLSDRFGIRITLSAYILLWSAMTAALGFSTGIVSLLAYRLGCGFAQAGAYPSCGRAVRDWLPLTQRGMASSLVAFGGRAGGAIAPVLTALLMLWIAVNQGSPELTPEEILDPEQIRERFASPAEFHWMKVVFNGKSATADFSDRTTIAELLNQTDPLMLLARQDQIVDGLPQELQRRVQRFRDQSPTGELDQRQARRQFWEAAFPQAIKKLEARGWRAAMMFYGFFGIAVAAIFWFVFRDQPEQHPWTNEAEVALIGNTVPSTGAANTSSPQAAEAFPWRAVLSNVGLWGNCLCQFGTNVGWLFLVTWFARYLSDVHQVPVVERGMMVSLTIFAGMFGMLAGGPWTDRLTARFGLKWGRRIPIASSRLMAAFGYVLCILATLGVFGELGTRLPAWACVVGLGIVAIFTDVGVAATWAYAQDIAGRHTAAVLGWGNMWGNLGAAVAPPLYNLVVGESPSLSHWNGLFIFCGAAFLVSAGGAWLMDSSYPLRKPEVPV